MKGKKKIFIYSFLFLTPYKDEEGGLDYASYRDSHDIPYPMVAGRPDGGFWPEDELGYAGGASGDPSAYGLDPVQSSTFRVSDDAVALPSFHNHHPTYDDVDYLPAIDTSLTPTHELLQQQPRQQRHQQRRLPASNSSQGWLAPPISERNSREPASSREGSSIRSGSAYNTGRGGDSSRATSPRDSAGSRNGSRASIFARRFGCRQS